MKIGIIGNGNVGTNLCKGIQQNGFTCSIFARSPKNSSEKHINEIFSRNLDFVIIAVNDGQIGDLAERLSKLNADTILVHTSGATPIDVLDNESHKNLGVLYPLQTIHKDIETEWLLTPIFIQASNHKTEESLFELANKLSNEVYKSTDESRLVIHLAAVLTNNFYTHLAQLAYDLLEQSDINKCVLSPILKNTLEKIAKNPPEITQTGPAVRGDKITMQRHQKIISDRNLSQIYESLSNSISQYNAKK